MGRCFHGVDDMWMPRQVGFFLLHGKQPKKIVRCENYNKSFVISLREGGLIILWRMDHGPWQLPITSLGMMTSTDSRDFVQLVPIRVAAEISSDLTMVVRSPKLL